MPTDPGIDQPFFEGIGADYAVPWQSWLPVLLVWQPFIWALFLVMIAAMVILRRQWVDNERLAYPLVQLPLAMTEEVKSGEFLPPFFKNRVMWIGFAIPATWSTLHGLYSYFPELVPFAGNVDLIDQTVPIMGNSTQLLLKFRFHILGYFYFLKTEVALSLWVFNLLACLLEGLLQGLGIVGSQSLGPGHGIRNPIFVHQSVGAMVVLFLGGWTLPFAGLNETATSLGMGLLQVGIFIGKLLLFMGLFIWVRWMLPRFRYDQLMDLGWKRFVPLALANIVVTALYLYVEWKLTK